MSDSSGAAPHPEAAPLDTTLVVVSPENIAFQFRLAGPALRALASLVDGLVIVVAAIALYAAVALVKLTGSSFDGLFLVAIFFLWWGYGAAFEALNNGQTPGKAALGLRVVSRTGLSINASQAVLRNLIRAVDAAPPFFPGLLAMTVSPRFERLGDLAAGTIVVLGRSRRHVPPPRTTGAEAAWIADVVPPGFVPGPPLAEALAAYVGRRDALSAGRRQELAGILAGRLCAAWEAPEARDPDALVRAVYGRVHTPGEAS